MGTLDGKGNLAITGRLKELIITSGGENVAPVLIENNIKEELKFLSNAMVVGDARKYLTVVLTIKHAVDKEGKLAANELNPDIQPIL
jgi:long-chain-fatty-acid--CoA ligase ACSBG